MTTLPHPASGPSWENPEKLALAAGRALSFREKLEWLEEAQRLGERLRACRVRQADPAHPGQWIIVDRAAAAHSKSATFNT
jgi:hypothetical protein